MATNNNRDNDSNHNSGSNTNNHNSHGSNQRHNSHNVHHEQNGHEGAADINNPQIEEWNCNLSAVIHLAEMEMQALGPSIDPVNEETLTLGYRRELIMNLTVLRQWRSSDENEMLLNVLGGGNSYGDMGLRTRRNND